MTMKYYDYSVKKTLTDHFGRNTIFEMRRPHKSYFESGEDKNLLPLLWQYADNLAIGLCLDEWFLLDTVLEDDYIAYIIQFGAEKYVYLMFMVTEDEPYFHIDNMYAKVLIRAWSDKGFKPLILRACISVEYYGNDRSKGFRLCYHNKPGRGTALYELRQVNGSDMLVFCVHPCWEYYYQKIVSVSVSCYNPEYECLFEDDTLITTGEEKNKKTISEGLDAVKAFLKKAPVYIGYTEFRGTKTYSRILLAGDKEVNLSVNRRNLICEINIRDFSGNLIKDESAPSYGSLLEEIPELHQIRVLDPVQIHGYAFQLSYADDSVRNYYLKCFDEPMVPVETDILGYQFNKAILDAVSFDESGNVHFQNGYTVPRHHLYYRSYRQVDIEYTDRLVYSQDGIEIRSIYRLPLLEFKRHFSAKQYRGKTPECFGPNQPWVDAGGKRVSDVAFITKDESSYHIGAALVCVEPTAMYGYLNPDGTWLAPPVYDKADKFSQGSAKAKRMVDGKEATFLITEDGKEIPIPFDLNVDHYDNGLCRYNAQKWDGPRPNPGYYYDYDEASPGKWGFVDLEGNIVIEPRYVYAIGFWNADGDHSVVARFVGEALCWGVIDRTGKEVIPCKYPGLYCRWGYAVAYQTEKDGPYGLMDFNGNTIVEPKFGYIEEYDPKHNLVSAGDSEDDLGVYSISLGKMLTPTNYDCIDYGERMISCEIQFTGEEEYFDYNGNRLSFDEYSSVYESKALLHVRKDGKVGVIDWDNNVIIPPVLENGLDTNIEYYKRGYLKTGRDKLKGLSKVTGEVILPEVFSEISFRKNYVIASSRTDSNWDIKDYLFTLDGKSLLEGAYRNMHINNDGILTAETPLGKEYLIISPY